MAKKFTKLSDFDEAFEAGKQAEYDAFGIVRCRILMVWMALVSSPVLVGMTRRLSRRLRSL